MSRRISLVLLVVFLLAGVGRPQDAVDAASRISVALDENERLLAMNLWEENNDAILGSIPASITTAKAFLRFGGGELAMRYQEIPEECAAIAVECLDAAGAGLLQDDHGNRLLVSRGLLDAAGIYLARGHGDQAGDLQDRALEMLRTVTAAEAVPKGAWMELGRVYEALASRDPVHVEDHITKAGEAFERAAELSGKSGALYLKIGETRSGLAEALEKRLLSTPKDHKLERAIRQAWEEAIEAFDAGLKLERDNPNLKTAYNECLWEMEQLTNGRCRLEPITRSHTARYGRFKLDLPESSWWRIKAEAELEDRDDLFIAYKKNRRRGQWIYIKLDQYRWTTNYTNKETGSSVGGDNISGLARRAEKSAQEFFVDVKERIPLKEFRLNRKIREAEGFAVRGMDKDGDLLEYRCIYFKQGKIQRTYRLLVIADMGTLKRNPYELEIILDSMEPVSK